MEYQRSLDYDSEDDDSNFCTDSEEEESSTSSSDDGELFRPRHQIFSVEQLTSLVQSRMNEVNSAKNSKPKRQKTIGKAKKKKVVESDSDSETQQIFVRPQKKVRVILDDDTPSSEATVTPSRCRRQPNVILDEDESDSSSQSVTQYSFKEFSDSEQDVIFPVSKSTGTPKSNKNSFLYHVPLEVWDEIWKHLTLLDICRLSKACSLFRNLGKSLPCRHVILQRMSGALFESLVQKIDLSSCQSLTLRCQKKSNFYPCLHKAAIDWIQCEEIRIEANDSSKFAFQFSSLNQFMIKFLETHRNIKRIYLGQTTFTGRFFRPPRTGANLPLWPKLEKIDFPSDMPNEICHKFFHFSFSQLSMNAVYKHLTRVSFSGAHLDASFLRAFFAVYGAQLEYCLFSGSYGFKILTRAPNDANVHGFTKLKALFLNRTAISFDYLTVLTSNLEHCLQCLDISYCTNVHKRWDSNKIRFVELKRLLVASLQITSQQIVDLVLPNSNLKEFDCSVTIISETDLEEIAIRCPKLEHVKYNRCPELSRGFKLSRWEKLPPPLVIKRKHQKKNLRKKKSIVTS